MQSPVFLAALLLEGLAVGALIDSRIGLVGAHCDCVERAVFGAVTVVGALIDRAADSRVLVGTIHEKDLLCLISFLFSPAGGELYVDKCNALSYTFHIDILSQKVRLLGERLVYDLYLLSKIISAIKER